MTWIPSIRSRHWQSNQKGEGRGKSRLVRITEHGEGPTCSAAKKCSKVASTRAIKDALYEAKLDAVIARGLADYEAGRFVGGAEAARAEIARRAESHG